MSTVVLDEECGFSPPSGLRGIAPYKHQLAAAGYYLQLEAEPHRQVDGMHGAYSSTYKYSDSLGSGKTLAVLMIILSRPVPYTRAPHYIYTKYGTTGGPVIYAKSARADGLVRANLVIVNSSVYDQWRTTIRDYTCLSVTCVHNYYSLQKFIAAIKEGGVGSDVVLLRNGRVSGGSFLEECKIQKRKDSLHIVSVVAEAMKTLGLVFARTVFDDYDCAEKPPFLPFSLVTLFVSSTRSQKASRAKNRAPAKYETFDDYLRSRVYRVGDIDFDPLLMTCYNFKCSPKLIKASAGIPHFSAYQYVFDNPDDNYMKIIGMFDDDVSERIVEALNGNAYGEAAQILGMQASSAHSLLERILQNRYNEAVLARERLTVAERAFRECEKNLTEFDGSTPTELGDAVRAVLACKDPVLRVCCPKMLAALAGVVEQNRKICEAAANMLQRIEENLKMGSCQICYEELKDISTGVFIARCCGVLMCGVCSFRSCKFNKRHNSPGYTGTCPQCRQELGLSDLILINKDLEDAPSLVEAPAHRPPPSPNMKLDSLLAIVRGESSLGPRKQVKIQMAGLIKGSYHSPHPEGQPRKIIVFAGFDETVRLIGERLSAEDIPYLRLQGKHFEISRTVELFNTTDLQVLLINSAVACAGLNLQCASDIIYYHKVRSANIEAQIAGRAHRIGRKHGLTIHYLLYKNEV